MEDIRSFLINNRIQLPKPKSFELEENEPSFIMSVRPLSETTNTSFYESELKSDIELTRKEAKEILELLLKFIVEDNIEFAINVGITMPEYITDNEESNTIYLDKEKVKTMDDLILQIAFGFCDIGFGHLDFVADPALKKTLKLEKFDFDEFCIESDIIFHESLSHYKKQDEFRVRYAVKINTKEELDLLDKIDTYYMQSEFENDDQMKEFVLTDEPLFHIQKVKHLIPILNYMTGITNTVKFT